MSIAAQSRTHFFPLYPNQKGVQKKLKLQTRWVVVFDYGMKDGKIKTMLETDKEKMPETDKEKMPETVLSFTKTVKALHETDIGDFKRKVISYLNRMESDINKNSLKPFFHQFKESLICNNTRDIEELRDQILHKIKKIRKEALY